MTDFPESDGSPTGVTARVTFLPGPGAQAFRYLAVYRTDSPYVTIRLDGAALDDGRAATVERHERNASATESRMWIGGTQGAGVVLRGFAAPHANGRFHIGVLLIPYDQAWRQVASENGTPLQIYAYTALSGVGVDQGPLFVGSGNVPSVSALVAAAAVAGGVALRFARGNS